MKREATGSLFDEPEQSSRRSRPMPPGRADAARSLEEFVGQADVVGENRSWDGASPRGKLSSLILWGPPGSGKTTLARLIAARNGAEFIALSAVLAGVKDVRAAIDEARKSQRRRTGEPSSSSTRSIASTRRSRTHCSGAVEDGTITPDRCHHREPVVRGQLRPSFSLPRRGSATASGRKISPRSSTGHSADPERGLAAIESAHRIPS